MKKGRKIIGTGAKGGKGDRGSRQEGHKYKQKKEKKRRKGGGGGWGGCRTEHKDKGERKAKNTYTILGCNARLAFYVHLV